MIFNNNFKDLVENHVEEIMVATDKNGNIVWVNKWFTELTKYTFEEVKGKKPGSFLQGEETSKATISKMKNALKQGKGFNVNIVNYSKENKKYWLNINCTPIYNDNNELEYFLAVERDITSEYDKNQKRLNSLIEELEKVSEQKSELIQLMYKLAHDLKAPLHNIGGLTGIANIENEKIKKMIEFEVDRSKKLIDKLLSNSNRHNEKIKLKFEKVNVCEIVNYLVDINTINIEKSKLKINLSCRKQLEIKTDKILFTQIIENLLTNALKYAPTSTEIIINITEVDNKFYLEISNETDTLEEWQLKRMFKPFQNFNMESNSESHGIGAFIINKYVNLLGGNIEPSIQDSRVYFNVSLPKNRK